MERTTEFDDRSLGGDRVTVRCPHCGHDLKLLDHRFLDYGPVRCGACGEVVTSSTVGRLVEEALSGTGSSA